MSIYANARRDERIREYLPVKRILWQSGCSGAEIMPGNLDLQPRVAGPMSKIRIAKGGGILLDFGIELHGGVRLLCCRKGRARLRFGESASEAMGTPDQDHAIHNTVLDLPAMGMLEYGNTAFRFVRIDAVGGALELQNVIAVALYRDLEWIGSFESSDERLNRIWQTGAYTLLLNMQDYIYDGAKRDRLVWMGDLNPEVRSILVVFGSIPLIPTTLDFLRGHTPLPAVMNNMTSYNFWWIITVYDYYLHSGDRAWLEQQKEYLAGLLRQCLSYVTPDGKEAVPGDRFLDWPSRRNPAALHAGLQGLLYWAFGCGTWLCRELGIDSADFEAVHSRMAEYIPDCGSSKAAAAVQTLSGLADRRDVLLRDPFHGVSTFYGCYMLFAQPTAPALELIRRYWGGMLDYGATTFWEDFDLDWLRNTSPISELPVAGRDDLHADFGNYCYVGLRHSLCHGWAAGPTAFLSERLGGIRRLEPGCRRLAIRPDLAGLDYLKLSFPTPAGAVKIEAERGRKPVIDAPAGVTVVEE